jgi:hypothetical protein
MGQAKQRGTFEQRKAMATGVYASAPGEVEPIKCKCGSQYWQQVFRLSVLSKLNPRNPTGKDQVLNQTVFVCHSCGMELNFEKENSGSTGS